MALHHCWCVRAVGGDADVHQITEYCHTEQFLREIAVVDGRQDQDTCEVLCHSRSIVKRLTRREARPALLRVVPSGYKLSTYRVFFN